MKKIKTHKGYDVFEVNTNRGIAYCYELNSSNQMQCTQNLQSTIDSLDSHLARVERNKQFEREMKRQAVEADVASRASKERLQQKRLLEATDLVNKMSLEKRRLHDILTVYYLYKGRNRGIQIKRISGKLFEVKDGTSKVKKMYLSELKKFLIAKKTQFQTGRWI